MNQFQQAQEFCNRQIPKAELGNCPYCLAPNGCCALREECPHCGRIKFGAAQTTDSKEGK